MATELDYAWAAGFFDGEGAISIHKKRRPEGKDNFTLILRLSQNDPEPLLRLQTVMGVGVIHPHWGKRKRDGVQELMRVWLACGTKARICLERMLPHFTLKRERALVAIDFQKVLEGGRRGPRGLRPEERSLQRSFYDAMIALNSPWSSADWAAAETKSEGRQYKRPRRVPAVCDSPIFTNDKGEEAGRNDQPTVVVH